MNQADLENISLPKWPQMRVTGVPVTVDQAKEIIFRTDSFFTDLYEHSGGNAHKFNQHYRNISGISALLGKYENREIHSDIFKVRDRLIQDFGLIETGYVSNDWASCAYVYGPHGWCSPEGVIFYTDNVGKWPSVSEILDDWKNIAKSFPYLDLHATLMDKEHSEDDIMPLVNIRVVGGNAELLPPDISVHDVTKDRTQDDIEKYLSQRFSTNNSSCEIGLPLPWYEEFAARVKAKLIEYGEIS